MNRQELAADVLVQWLLVIGPASEDQELVDLHGRDGELGHLKPAGLSDQRLEDADLGGMVRVVERDLGGGKLPGDGLIDQTKRQRMVWPIEVLVGGFGPFPVQVVPALTGIGAR